MNHSDVAVDLARQHLVSRGVLRIKVTSTSMMPLMQIGDVVSVKGLVHKPRIGDILMVEHNGMVIVHRLVGYNRWGLVLQGDALMRPDLPLGREKVLGMAVERERDGVSLDLKSFGMRFQSILVVIKKAILAFGWRVWHGI